MDMPGLARTEYRNRVVHAPGLCNTLSTPWRNTPASGLRSGEESRIEQYEPSPGRRCRWRERAKPDRGSENAQPGRRGNGGPSPGCPKKAPARIPGQLRDPREEKNPGHPSARRDRNGNVEHPDRPGKSGASVSASAGRNEQAG